MNRGLLDPWRADANGAVAVMTTVTVMVCRRGRIRIMDGGVPFHDRFQGFVVWMSRRGIPPCIQDAREARFIHGTGFPGFRRWGRFIVTVAWDPSDLVLHPAIGMVGRFALAISGAGLAGFGLEAQLISKLRCRPGTTVEAGERLDQVGLVVVVDIQD